MKTRLAKLGLIEYGEAWDLQKRLVDLRKKDLIEDTLLLLSHPDVITLGREDSRQYLKRPEEELSSAGVQVLNVGRGGEATYHGPGQLVAYPILKLQEKERDLREYLRRLERMGLEICRSLGFEALLQEGLTGVWYQGKKLASIGVRASSWVTYHGMAMNRTSSQPGFDWIVPCGIEDCQAISLEEIAGQEISSQQLEDEFQKAFTKVFERQTWEISFRELCEFLKSNLESEVPHGT